MDDMLTIAEIQCRYGSQWVLVEDPETDENLEVTAGKVRWHSPERDEVYRKALELRPARFAVLFTGASSIPSGTAIVL